VTIKRKELAVLLHSLALQETVAKVVMVAKVAMAVREGRTTSSANIHLMVLMVAQVGMAQLAVMAELVAQVETLDHNL
jgi:hypothetical protein